MRRLLLAALGVLLAVSDLPVEASAQRAVADPLTLFAKMMPVLSHDRCVNCHGATNPYTGDYHPGAIGTTTPCNNCHTASSGWRLAPPIAAFFKKTTRQLCQHFESLGTRGEDLAIHLQTDELIGLAFIGRRGNSVGREFAKPPPMSRPDFVRAYRTWARDADGACSAWEGTITRTETITTDTAPGTGPNSRSVFRRDGMVITSWQNGNHTHAVRIKDGVATVSTTLNGEANQKTVARSDNCESTTFVRDAYSLVAAKAPPADAGEESAGPLIATGEASIRVGLAADGSYKIHIVPPRETTRMTSTTTNSNTCGVQLPKLPPSTETSDWDEWTFEIIGRLSDPKDRRHIKGQSTIEVDSSYDPSFGLAYHAHVARQDGTPYKFRITMTWDLSRVP